MKHSLDVICVGRAAIDLYGEQIGGRLEDMLTFTKYLGGSPANTFFVLRSSDQKIKVRLQKIFISRWNPS